MTGEFPARPAFFQICPGFPKWNKNWSIMMTKYCEQDERWPLTTMTNPPLLEQSLEMECWCHLSFQWPCLKLTAESKDGVCPDPSSKPSWNHPPWTVSSITTKQRGDYPYSQVESNLIHTNFTYLLPDMLSPTREIPIQIDRHETASDVSLSYHAELLSSCRCGISSISVVFLNFVRQRVQIFIKFLSPHSIILSALHYFSHNWSIIQKMTVQEMINVYCSPDSDGGE
jgi:hypothetical protein